jgi:hypothetical protein
VPPEQVAGNGKVQAVGVAKVNVSVPLFFPAWKKRYFKPISICSLTG